MTATGEQLDTTIERMRRVYRIKLRDKAVELKGAVVRLQRDPSTRGDLFKLLRQLAGTAGSYGLAEVSARADIVRSDIKGKRPMQVSLEVTPLINMLLRISARASRG